MLYFNMNLFFLLKKVFFNFYFDRVDNTFARLRERGEFFDQGAQSSEIIGKFLKNREKYFLYEINI